MLLTRGLCGIGVGGMLGLGRYLSTLPTYILVARIGYGGDRACWACFADGGDVTTVGSITLTDAVGLQRRPYYQSLGYVVYGTGSGSVSTVDPWSPTRIDGLLKFGVA